MSEDKVILQKRTASFRRLLEASDRVKDRPPLMEKTINNFPIRSALFYRILMRMAGIKVGNNVRFLGRLKVKLRGNPENIIIKDNVVLGNNVDLRNRENGKIILHEDVYLDDNVRIVAARDGKVEIDRGAEIGGNTIINSGGDTYIGRFSLIANNVNINSSSHGYAKSKFIKDQPHEHGKVQIGDDVWLGGFVTVVMNTTIGGGAVIGANSLARGDIPPFAICVGSPAKPIKFRS